MIDEERVDEKELKAFLDKELIEEHGEEWFRENKERLDNEWDYVMNLFGPTALYKKNPDGTFSFKDEKRFNKVYG